MVVEGDYVTDHQLTIIKIKAELMDLWTESAVVKNYSQWFDLIRPKLYAHFEIEQAGFLIYNKGRNVFMPLQGHKSTTLMDEAIPIDLMAGKSLDSYIKLFRKKGFEYADEILIFRGKDTEPLALLLLKSTSRWREFSSSPYFIEFEEAVSNYIQAIGRLGFFITREKKFRQLFKVTELFNSTMSSQVILDGIMNMITESFSNMKVNLLLSQEQQELAHTYRLFDYSNERPSAIDAFVSGEVTIEHATDLQCILLNAPIKGRQGIYGVLQIIAPPDYYFLGTQRNFIRILANTAGSALENASLYEQSHRLNEDLKLVNETSRKLNSNMQFDEMLVFLRQQLLSAFKPDQIAFVFYNEDKSPYTSQMSTNYSWSNEGRKYIKFASNHILKENTSLFEANFSVTRSQPSDYESIIAIPITNQEDLVGFVICMHKQPYFFSFDNFKLMGSLIGHSSLALANSMLRDQLRELANKDHLTKLYTRRYFDAVVGQSIEDNEGGVFMLFDIDDFKAVNDTYGHQVGDNVLQQIATFIINEFADIGIAARWGGEEFAIYFPFIDKSTGKKLAQQLIETLPDVTAPSVTISVGMNNWVVGQKNDVNKLFNLTDTALYSAKNNGKNQLVIHGTKLLH